MDRTIPKKIIPFFWLFIKKYKFSFFAYVFIMMTSDLSYLFFSPFLLKLIVDGISTNTLEFSREFFLILLFSFSDFFCIFIILKKYFEFHSINKMSEDIRIKLFSHLLEHSVTFFHNEFSGNLSNKVNTLSSIMPDLVNNFFKIIRDFNYLLLIVITIFLINKQLGMISVIWSILVLLVTIYFTAKISKKAGLIQEIQDNISGLISDDFLNISNIKIFASNLKEQEKLSLKIKEKIKICMESCKIDKSFNIIMFVIQSIFFFSILLISARLFLDKNITIGTYFFLFEALRKVFHVIGSLPRYLREFLTKRAIFEESIKVIATPIKIKDRNNADELTVNDGRIIFKNIKFSYEKK